MSVANATFSCDQCGKRYPWKPEYAGRKVKCKCGAVLTAPTRPPAAAQARPKPADSGMNLDDLAGLAGGEDESDPQEAQPTGRGGAPVRRPNAAAPLAYQRALTSGSANDQDAQAATGDHKSSYLRVGLIAGGAILVVCVGGIILLSSSHGSGRAGTASGPGFAARSAKNAPAAGDNAKDDATSDDDPAAVASRRAKAANQNPDGSPESGAAQAADAKPSEEPKPEGEKPDGEKPLAMADGSKPDDSRPDGPKAADQSGGPSDDLRSPVDIPPITAKAAATSAPATAPTQESAPAPAAPPATPAATPDAPAPPAG